MITTLKRALFTLSSAMCLCAAPLTFTSTGPFTLQDPPPSLSEQGPATNPYPLSVEVAGFTAVTTSVTLTLGGLSHTFPDDLHFLLVSPTGQTLYVMGNAGGSVDVNSCSLTFSDLATSTAPDSSALVCGSTYLPNSVYGALEPFAAGTPSGPYGTSFSVFNGFSPNGTWKLYIGDDGVGDSGSLGSWSLTIDAADTAIPEPSTVVLLTAGLAAIALRRRK